jgi:hypothetical protein
MAARARGLSYDQLVSRMIELAWTEWQAHHDPARRGARART